MRGGDVMAGVSTSVSVNDNMSAAFGNMANAINVCLGAFFDMQMATNEGFDTAQIEAARGAILDVQNAAGQLEHEIQDAEEQQRQFNNAANQGTTAMDGMLKKAMGIVSAYASWRAVEKVVETADSITNATARIDMMNDGVRTTEEVMQRVYQAAENARGSYLDMATVVAKLGNNAGSAFDNNTEQIIQFAELVQKQFVIAGASATEASNAMLQLTQGLGSGTLRGDELNSIFEQAPNLIQNIAGYIQENEELAASMAKAIGVSAEEMATNAMGHIREVASEGLISADIVKNAMFASADEINTKFESMPVTWAQVGQSIKNQALVTFQPVLQMIGQMTAMDEFQTVVAGITNGLATLAAIAMPVVEFMINGAAFIVDNWSIISPIIGGIVTILGIYLGIMAVYNTIQAISKGITVLSTIASVAHGAAITAEMTATTGMTTAQLGFNAALYACPVVWIIGIIIVLIGVFYGVIAAINKTTDSSISATGIIVGVLSTAVAFIWNLFLGLLDFIFGFVNYWYNLFGAFANFFANVFNDPIGSVIHLFGDMADAVLGILENIARAMDKIFGSSLADTVSGWRSGLDDMIEITANQYGNGTYEAVMDEINLSSDSLGLERWAYTDAYNWGYGKGQGIEEKVSEVFNFNTDDILSGMEGLGDYESAIADNTGAVADSLEVAEDNLAWMKDIAEREVIDRTVFRDIKVDLGGVNNVVNNMADLDGVGQYIADSIVEQMVTSAEGV